MNDCRCPGSGTSAHVRGCALHPEAQERELRANCQHDFMIGADNTPAFGGQPKVWKCADCGWRETRGRRTYSVNGQNIGALLDEKVTVRLFSGGDYGNTIGMGRMVGYSPRPMVCIELADGSRKWWVADLAEVVADAEGPL